MWIAQFASRTKLAVGLRLRFRQSIQTPCLSSQRLHEDNVEEILDSVAVPNGLLEQIDEIVKYVYKKTSHAGGGVVINYKNDYPIAF